MSITPPSPSPTTIDWTEGDQTCSALWRSERGSAAPKKMVLADDTMNADTAYRLACEGTGLLWRGDFHNARMLLQALARRTDRLPERQQFKANKQAARASNKLVAKSAMPAATPAANAPTTATTAAQAFHQHRMSQAQRARILGMVLIQFNADYAIPLRRAPDAREACTQAWGAADANTPASVASLRELLGVISSHEWRKNGIEIPALGETEVMGIYKKIHPHYGVFSPVRGEYVELVLKAPLPVSAAAKKDLVAWDIGAGTGVLAAVLAQRGVQHIIATDNSPRALDCARENVARLGLGGQITVQEADLFPQGKAHLIVCNPPWLPARPSSPLEQAVYDEASGMLLGFLNGLSTHLAKGGEGWLIMSDLAEHLGLRSATEVADAISAAGLKVIAKLITMPMHPKAREGTDALHAARAKEVTTLWRLAVA